MSSIRIDGGIISINDEELSAVIDSVMVNQEVVWKENTLLLESGNEKVFNGFQDAEINIALTIFEPHDGGTERFASLAILGNAFKALEDGKAVVYQIYGDIFEALSIREAVFSALSHTEVDDSIQVSMTLKENAPKVAAVQSQQSSASSAESQPEAEWSAMSDEEERGVKDMEGMVG